MRKTMLALTVSMLAFSGAAYAGDGMADGPSALPGDPDFGYSPRFCYSLYTEVLQRNPGVLKGKDLADFKGLISDLNNLQKSVKMSKGDKLEADTMAHNLVYGTDVKAFKEAMGMCETMPEDALEGGE